ncbi:MAG: hypothetical protein LUC91_11385 [Prevotella sp.]|nr:hypothetical protein [Prevotella sp.]
MRKHILKITLICLSPLLFVSCMKQHKAESVVKDFLNENLTESKYSVSFSKIDSTAYVNDIALSLMKEIAKHNKAFKKDINYKPNNKKGKLVYTKATIYVGKDTLKQTFYLDNDITYVVGFKEN